MSHQKITRDEERVHQALILMAAAAEDRRKGRARVSKEDENKGTKVFNDFIETYHERLRYERLREAAIEHRNAMVKKGNMVYRLTLSVAEFKSERLASVAPEDRYVYDLPPADQRPRSMSDPRWLTLIKRLHDVEVKLVEAGHEPIAVPSPDELSACIAALEDGFAQLRAIKLAMSEIHDRIQTLRVLFDRKMMKFRLMIRGDCLERGMTLAATREVLRNYGFIYRKPRTPAPEGENQNTGNQPQGEEENGEAQNVDEQEQETETETETDPGAAQAAAAKPKNTASSSASEAAVAKQKTSAKTASQQPKDPVPSPDPLTELEELMEELDDEELESYESGDEEDLWEDMEEEDNDENPFRPEPLSLDDLLRPPQGGAED